MKSMKSLHEVWHDVRCVAVKAAMPLLLSAPLLFPSACKMAPKDNPGDTVAASEFYPPDTAALARQAAKARKNAPVKDSTDIFVVGEGSTRRQLQLLSYPSRRDTLLFGKARHMRVSGSADYGHVVRVSFYVAHGDTLVQRVEEVEPEALQAEATVAKALH